MAELNANQDPHDIQLRPTLYIGLGGTGMEVILRIRRRILSAVWGFENPIRIDSMSGFPVAQFIHFDLDQGARVESDKSQVSDPLAERVKLLDEDKLVELFEIETYSKSEDDLSKYPHIEEWSPLTPRKIRELGIDPSKGAGQIRAISRLYFFDKQLKIREKIRSKLNRLKAGLSNDAQLKALGLRLDTTSYRIVVIGSVAGGTGAGTFLDMGYLARYVAKSAVSSAEVDMMLFLPTGYQGANKERTEANGYASLMELETCMRGGSNYVTRWENTDPLELSDLPYKEVYLIDSGNLTNQHLISSDQKQVYDMVADTLFEDFASVDFANKKRSVAVNQLQHKILLFSPPVPGNRFGDMRLSYSRAYSSFGQAMLDTQGGVRRDIRTYRWASGMIEAFFGVSSTSIGGNRATDKQRDDFMAAQMQLAPLPFTALPEFSARDVKAGRGEFIDYQITEALLADRRGSLVDGIQQRVGDQIDNIAASFERGEWGARIRELVKQLEHDVVRDQDSNADTTEDRVIHKSKDLFKEITSKLYEQLYVYLDDKEFGGLEFVLSLVEQIKDRLENSSTGLIATLAANAQRYAELRDALRTHEYEHLLGNLEQTKGFSLFGNKDDQARLILKQLRQTIGDYLKFHVRAKAADQASDLLQKIAHWLGERQGLDTRGDARWTGLVGEFQKGRGDVLSMLESIDRKVGLLLEDTKKDHVAYIRIETREEDAPLPAAHKLREWAEEVFRDMGASRQLFPKLTKPEEREKLIGLLRLKADRQISLPMMAQQPGQKDPLVDALDAMGPVKRQQRFEELLTRAMPWIDASWNDFKLRPDQFKCYIGVSDPAQYKHLEEEIRATIPTSVGITPDQVSFVTTGTPGRMVCYCEVSGIPLTVLRGMESWRESYRRESEKIPLHTHRDPTRFSHPLAPSTTELNRLADDFQHYLLAVMLGVLTRDSVPKALTREINAKSIPPVPYLYAVSPGDARRMGNERAFRLNGLPASYKQAIINDVDDEIGVLNGLQLASLAALAKFYANDVYTPPLIADETGAEVPIKGFASAIADETAVRLRERAARKNLTTADLENIVQRSLDQIENWTQAVQNSDTDAYSWEIKSAEKPRLKRIVRAEFFQQGWLENLLGPVIQTIATPPPLPGPLPPTQPQYQYYLAAGGQQTGPHPLAHIQQWIAARQLDAAAMGWREGLAQWQPLGQIPELAPLFVAVTPPPLPGTPPPPLLPQ